MDQRIAEVEGRSLVCCQAPRLEKRYNTWQSSLEQALQKDPHTTPDDRIVDEDLTSNLFYCGELESKVVAEGRVKL